MVRSLLIFGLGCCLLFYCLLAGPPAPAAPGFSIVDLKVQPWSNHAQVSLNLRGVAPQRGRASSTARVELWLQGTGRRRPLVYEDLRQSPDAQGLVHFEHLLTLPSRRGSYKVVVNASDFSNHHDVRCFEVRVP